MKTLAIVVPVYFNSGSLLALAAELAKIEVELAKRDVALQLIFVDDGSGDDSLEKLLEIGRQRPGTIVVKLSRNFGAIQAVKTGLTQARCDCFMWLAADLQDPPELILMMIEHWQKGAKCVMCTRADRDDPLPSKILARIYYILVKRLVSKNYPEGGFDVALMDAQLLPAFLQSAKNINISLLAYWLGFKPVTLPYQRLKRVHGKSRWTFAKKVKLLIDSLVGFSFAPIRLMSLLGLLIAGLSVAYGLFVVVGVFITGRQVPGFATLAALILFLFGLVITMLGILGEYLWRILDELNKRPEAVIDEIYRGSGESSDGN
jgi:glycosyltransferase involved in cell wall biosynthesis